MSAMVLAAVGDADDDGILDVQDLCSYTNLKAKVWTSGEYVGCAEGQVRDKDRDANKRKNTYKQTMGCEGRLVGNLQTLIGHLERGDYPSENCRWIVSGTLDGIQPYVEFGNQDTKKYGAIFENTLPMGRLQDRLKICLTTTRYVAGQLDSLDRQDCRFDIDEWRERTTRIPAPSGAPATSLSDPGTYTVMGENTIVGANGVIYTRSGNITHGSDGTVYTHSGSITIGSDGVTYVTSGSITHGSNGRTCIRMGNFINCF